jgi:glyoxylase-like metal-dependent hydrolase (beta-lactamase superfamily II)
VTQRFGGWEIDLLGCGSIELPAAALGPDRGPARTPVTATLLRGHGRTVLVDTGAGPCAVLWPGAGGDGLLGALERAGVAPSAITEILLTHLDFDHSGGVVAGTWPEPIAPAFGAAPVLVAEFGLAAWWDAEERTFNVGTPILRSLRDAGVLATFADGVELMPGVRVRSAPGHSPGHAALEISGGEGVLLHLADAIHDRSHVEHPDWDGYYDVDADAALTTRNALIAEAEARGAVVLASHIGAPGRIGRRNGVATWIDLQPRATRRSATP